MSIYDCTPAIGLGDIYDKVEKDCLIEYRSKGTKKWSLAEVYSKKIDNIYGDKVFSMMIVSLSSKKHYFLRDLSDFHWRYKDLYSCNKYLLEGYKQRTKEVRMVDPMNIKKYYNHIANNSADEALLIGLIKCNIISKKDVDLGIINISVHRRNNRKNGKRYIKVLKNDNVIGEFWQKEPHSVYVDTYVPKTWAISFQRKN